MTFRCRLLSLLALLSVACSTGCVERKLIVRSDPPGAAIYVDGELKGVAGPSGLSVPFEAYGTRAVVARLEGHVPRRQFVELSVPWYQVFPLGLFSDLLWPGTIVDEHRAALRLTPREAPRGAKALATEAQHFAETQERRP